MKCNLRCWKGSESWKFFFNDTIQFNDILSAKWIKISLKNRAPPYSYYRLLPCSYYSCLGAKSASYIDEWLKEAMEGCKVQPEVRGCAGVEGRTLVIVLGARVLTAPGYKSTRFA
jgi:hypothetical protein